MIVTIRTGPYSTAQGELVRCAECQCENGECMWIAQPNRQRTIRIGNDLITGTLIEREDK